MNVNFIVEVGLAKWVWRTAIRQYHKRVLRRGHQMYLPTGERFLLPLSSHFASEAYVTNGDVDWDSEALLFQLLQNKGCLLDIGANIGYYSLYMLPKVTRVYSFEPDPRMIELLRRNIGKKSNIHLIQKAVGKVVGKTSFTLETSGEVSHFTQDTDLKKNNIEVEVITIDSFVQEHNLTVEAIKTDVEGFDVEVLRGAALTLKTQRPIVLTEALPTLELFNIAQSANYTVFAFVRDQKRKREFIEVQLNLSKKYFTKMLFLVPEELKSTLIKTVDRVFNK